MEDLELPQELRSFLKKPFGKVFKGKGLGPAKKVLNEITDKRVIVVGDVTYRNMVEVGLKPNLAVLDLKTKRDENLDFSPSGKIIRVKNPPGWITKQLWDTIHENIEKDGIIILVEGEEDLAVIPCIIEADWGSVVLYGQPGEGIVLVNIDEESKYSVGSIFKIILNKDQWKLK